MSETILFDCFHCGKVVETDVGTSKCGGCGEALECTEAEALVLALEAAPRRGP